jgi:hypothetical protein
VSALRAVGGYFGGAKGAANPFSTDIRDANGQSVGGYTAQVMGPHTQMPIPGLLNPYDQTYDKMAMGELGAERKALLTPFSATVNTGPAPEMPKPEDLPKTDFSKADAALEAMRPIEMSEQAMMRSPGDEGLGTMLMHMGAGALGGRQHARDEIRDEQDKFDEKMSRFNAAIYQNEMGKAQVAHSEAVAQVQQNNEYNLNNWKVAYDRWSKNSNIDISGTNAVITQRDDKNGTMSVRTLPIQSAVDAAIAHDAAGVFQTMGGRQLAAQSQITGMTNALMGRLAINQMMGNGGANGVADAGAAAAPAFYGTFIARNGLTGDLLGPDGAKSLEQSTQKTLIGQGLQPGTREYMDRHDRIIATEIAKLGLKDPNMMQRIMTVGAPADTFNNMSRYYGRNESTRTDGMGRTSTSTTYDGSAADIFGD